MSVRVRVLGGAGEVGRTAVLVQSTRGEKAVLLDYGVGFDRNDRPIFPLHVRPRDLSCLVLSHAHLDHTGAAPSLYASSDVKLVATPLTMELTEILLEDMIKLSGYYLPYEHEDVKRMRRCLAPISYGEEIVIDKDVVIRAYNAGHIPGSMMTLVEMDGVRVLFTGDFNLVDTNLVRWCDLSEIPRDVDLVIMEGTYVSGEHPPREESERCLVGAVLETLEDGGTVLIPCFSIGRSQEVLLILAKHNIGYPIVIDGLARAVSQVMLKHSSYLRDGKTYERAVNSCIHVKDSRMRESVCREPCVIISPAGMLKGGPALYYLKRISRSRRNAIVLPSFQAPGTPGHILLTRGRVVIEGEEIEVRSKIYWVDLSAHSGRRELAEFIRHFREDTRIVIVHTDALGAVRFVNKLRDKYGVENVHVALQNGEMYVM